MAEHIISYIQRSFCTDVPIDLDACSSEISYSISRKVSSSHWQCAPSASDPSSLLLVLQQFHYL